MDDTEDDLKNLLNNPREALDLELKQWIDPTSNEGRAKIVRACLALWNNNGGRLLIGFRDDGTPDVDNAPADVHAVHAMFGGEKLQVLVSRYAAQAIAIKVQFVTDVGGQTHPVVTIPPGMRTPVAAKADLPGGSDKLLIKDNAVYVRTFDSNGRVSSAEARRGDWDRLIRICFDNREADIGGFVRRHLAALDLNSIIAVLRDAATIAKPPTTADRVTGEMERQYSRYLNVVAQREVQVPAGVGFRESLILVQGEFTCPVSNRASMERLLASAPHHTGWPPWVNLSGATRERLRPYFRDGGWEAMLDLLDPASRPFPPDLSYWRIEPTGVFYHIRALGGDITWDPDQHHRAEFDYILQIKRVAEVISVGLSFGRALGCDEAKASVIFGFRWRGLRKRLLTWWVKPMLARWNREVGAQDKVVTTATVPLQTPPAGIPPYVANAVRDLFLTFEGAEIDNKIVEAVVKDILN